VSSWHRGLGWHVTKITRTKTKEWKEPHFLRIVAGYLDRLSASLKVKADELGGTGPVVASPKREELRSLLEKYPDAVKQKLIEELGVGKTTFYKLLKEISSGRA
jgi:hypothetical protein